MDLLARRASGGFENMEYSTLSTTNVLEALAGALG